MEDNNNEVDALCPECGYAFKRHMDKVIQNNQKTQADKHAECPVCGCGECRIGT